MKYYIFWLNFFFLFSCSLSECLLTLAREQDIWSRCFWESSRACKIPESGHCWEGWFFCCFSLTVGLQNGFPLFYFLFSCTFFFCLYSNLLSCSFDKIYCRLLHALQPSLLMYMNWLVYAVSFDLYDLTCNIEAVACLCRWIG